MAKKSEMKKNAKSNPNELVALAFNKEGQLLASARPDKDKLYFDIEPEQLRYARVFVFPEPPSGIEGITLAAAEPGSYALDVKVAAGGATAATITTPELMAGERYLVVASGFVGGSQPGFTVLPLAEQFADDMDARVRVVHASPDAPAVDVGVVTADKAFTPLAPFSDLAFGATSEATGLSVGPAALTLGVAATGTIDPVATFDVTLSAGQQAFAVAAGSLTGTGEGFRLMLVDTTGFPWVTASVLPNGMN